MTDHINEVTEIPLFSKDEFLPDADDPAWKLYQKRVPTRAVRINGPFRVVTSESENEPFYCEDGYLAMDSRGYPYAIAKEEFEKIYELVEHVPKNIGVGVREKSQAEKWAEEIGA